SRNGPAGVAAWPTRPARVKRRGRVPSKRWMSRVFCLLTMLFALAAFPAAAFGVPAGPGVGADTDRDGVPDTGDNCPLIANASQIDFDGDLQGDACDADMDDDGTANGADAFPRNAAEQADTDGD